MNDVNGERTQPVCPEGEILVRFMFGYIKQLSFHDGLGPEGGADSQTTAAFILSYMGQTLRSTAAGASEQQTLAEIPAEPEP